jgi:S1-C subfamily serine protease
MVEIASVDKHSYAQKAGIKAGDKLVSVNGCEIHDVLDYRFYITDKKLTLVIERGGGRKTVSVKKPEYADIGLEFASYLMTKRKGADTTVFWLY